MDISAVKKSPSHCLGSGAQGTVFQGFDEATGQLVAIKEVIVDTATAESVTNEISLMKTLDHPHLVRYFGARQSPENPAAVQIVMEYVSGGSVAALIKKYGKLREAVARNYIRDVVDGLVYLHDICHVCHRDIKNLNLLLSPNGQVKIADFGASRVLLEGATLLKTCVGTSNYVAPEVLRGEPYGMAADIWSLSCVLFEMLTGRPPFHELSNPMAVMFRVASDETARPLLPATVHVSEQCKAFVEACCSRDPAKRPAAAELLRHPWLAAAAATAPSNQTPGAAALAPGGTSPTSASLSDGNTPRRQPTSPPLVDDPALAGSVSPAAVSHDETDFFPGKSKGDELDFTRLCQRCSKNIAVFSCDQCRSRSTHHQLCPTCWGLVHDHPRAASHTRAPLLLPRNGIAPPPEKTKRGASPAVRGASPLAPSRNALKNNQHHQQQQQHQQQANVGVTLASGDFVDLYVGEQSEWQCGRCTFLNDGPLTECEMCGHLR